MSFTTALKILSDVIKDNVLSPLAFNKCYKKKILW